ncbi:MAG TPA: hypothetical protein VHY91_18035 [Pirellulales bacterium]|nr:hypothetical protein [Pirellulales bacterium]
MHERRGRGVGSARSEQQQNGKAGRLRDSRHAQQRVEFGRALKMLPRQRGVAAHVFDAGQPMVRIGVAGIQPQDLLKASNRIVQLLERKENPAEFLVYQRILRLVGCQRLQDLKSGVIVFAQLQHMRQLKLRHPMLRLERQHLPVARGGTGKFFASQQCVAESQMQIRVDRGRGRTISGEAQTHPTALRFTPKLQCGSFSAFRKPAKTALVKHAVLA